MVSPTVPAKQPSQRVARHADYYIHGGDVVFRVENTLFRIHRYFFTRDSAFFRDKLPYPLPPGELAKGFSDNSPLVLEDVLHVDFERFLWVFYNPKYSLYKASIEEWASILKLAHQWQFVEVKSLAVRELERLEIPPLRKIVIYHKYAIDRNLLQAAYTALTIRDAPITIEEGQELGLEIALQLAHARELTRAPPGGQKSGHPQSLMNVGGAGLDVFIRDLFQLSSSEKIPGCHASPTPAHDKGADTNGVNSKSTGQGVGGTPIEVADGHASNLPAGSVNHQANGTPKKSYQGAC